MLQDELESIKEIDYFAGKEFIPEDELYRELLETYVKKLPIREQKIRECLDRQDMKQLMIEVHTLKSNSKAIGAMEMFQRARELEECAVQKDIDRISQLIDPFLEKLAVLQEQMQIFIKEKEHQPGTQTDHKKVIALLKELIQRLDSFDSDGAARLVDALWKFHYQEEEYMLMKLLEQQVDEFEYAAASNSTKKLLEIAMKQDR
ncbi:MAG: Hpt domain-containing protein [Clostridia bacterium]|nr:Hpt domain-containing protein [Clostridia bacterium]